MGHNPPDISLFAAPVTFWAGMKGTDVAKREKLSQQ